jgi:hypothetical protein
LGFVEIGIELERIESAIQLSSIKNHSTDKGLLHSSKQFIHCLNTTSQEQSIVLNPSISVGYGCYQQSQNSKRTPRIIGKRGTRDTEFLHPSSLAYSKRDQLICK